MCCDASTDGGVPCRGALRAIALTRLFSPEPPMRALILAAGLVMAGLPAGAANTPLPASVLF